jgi:hypothetical protein
LGRLRKGRSGEVEVVVVEEELMMQVKAKRHTHVFIRSLLPYLV